jgi:hypothetical protein
LRAKKLQTSQEKLHYMQLFMPETYETNDSVTYQKQRRRRQYSGNDTPVARLEFLSASYVMLLAPSITEAF